MGKILGMKARSADVKQPAPLEHVEQVRFMQRVDWTLPPAQASLVFAIPNGGWRGPKAGKRLKAEGVKPGAPDIVVAIARDGFHGLWIEMKRERGSVVSQSQRDMHAALLAEGYEVKIALGAEQAWRFLCRYLGLNYDGSVDL